MATLFDTEYMSRTDLGHVRWLGGASGAGKSTVSRLLAEAFDLQIYATDGAIAEHAQQPGSDAPLLTRFLEMDMDERWVERDAQTMLETFPWFAGERFDAIVRDLRSASGSGLVLAEGFRLLPRLVQPLLQQPWHAVWLIPTDEFRRSAFADRPEGSKFWLRTSDPELAFERLLQRDALFGDLVLRDAQALGLRAIEIDGKREAADIAQELARWFRLNSTSRL